MLRTILRRCALVLCGLLAGLVVAEGAARVVGPLPGEDILYGGPIPAPVGMYQWCKYTAKDPRSNFTGTLRALGVEVPIRFNAIGLRGGEVPAGTNWLAIGDSFTLGIQVREEETWQALLGAKVGKTILNGGVDAYSTVQAARRYEELADQVDVDTVILTYYLGNDLNDNEQAEQVLNAPEQDFTKPPPGLFERRWLTMLHTYSYLAAYVHVYLNRQEALVLAKSGQGRMKDDLSIWSYRGRPRLDFQSTYTRDALTELRDEAVTRGDRLIVSIAPPSYAIDDAMLTQLLEEHGMEPVGTDGPRKVITEIATTLGLEVCDLYPALKESYRAGRRPYLRFDGHWNRLGHRVVAKALADCIKAAR